MRPALQRMPNGYETMDTAAPENVEPSDLRPEDAPLLTRADRENLDRAAVLARIDLRDHNRGNAPAAVLARHFTGGLGGPVQPSGLPPVV